MITKILVCCHKKDVMATQYPYMPIQVGKAKAELDLGIQGDDSGDNISDKNASFCECTGMYWAWKNLTDVDVIGLCHYRRYFDFHNQISKLLFADNVHSSNFSDVNLNIPDEVINAVAHEGKIFVPKYLCQPLSLYDKYCLEHNSEDIRIVERILSEQGDDSFINAFKDVMHNDDKFITCNMCLMCWHDYDEYCTWLFGILFECEKRIDISNNDAVQRRVFGYIAERLFNVWLKAKNKDLVYLPLIKISDDKPSSFSERIHFKIGQLRKRILFRLLYKKY